MDVGDEGDDMQPSPPPEHEAGPSEQQVEEQETPASLSGYGPGAISAAYRAVGADVGRARSPTPPRALFRSTTGKGVAFTDADVIFLIRFLDYRTKQQDGKVDMVSFWKEVAAKVRRPSLVEVFALTSTASFVGSPSFSRVLDEVLQATQARVPSHLVGRTSSRAAREEDAVQQAGRHPIGQVLLRQARGHF